MLRGLFAFIFPPRSFFNAYTSDSASAFAVPDLIGADQIHQMFHADCVLDVLALMMSLYCLGVGSLMAPQQFVHDKLLEPAVHTAYPFQLILFDH